MKIYQHRQGGKVTTWFSLAVAAVMTVVGVCVLKPLLVWVPLLLVIGWLFGPGLIAKRVALDEIANVTCVRTNFFEGWGIHFSRFGWLYNVSGWEAVAIHLRNGRSFALGTDEPEALRAIIQQNLW
jgi:hypothetical protein